MSLRQPDVCICFGGRCWKQWCPETNRKTTDNSQYERPKGKKVIRKRKVLTLSDSIAEIKKDKNDE